MNFKPVTHVLFDLDGLLLNSEPIYEKVFADTVAKYDKEMTAEVRVKYLGTSERRACEICVADFQLPVSVDEFMRQAIELLHLLLKEVEFMPGAVRLVEHLAANNIPICVATGSNEDGVKIKTARYQDTFKLFHHIVKGTDPEVKKGKPAPDIFLIAASRFDQPANPENCLVFEDSPYGVQAGRAAGMQVVMVPAEYTTKDRQQEATLVLKSLEDFQPELFGLPAC